MPDSTKFGDSRHFLIHPFAFLRPSPFVLRHSSFVIRHFNPPLPQRLRTIRILPRARSLRGARIPCMKMNRLLLVATIAASILLPAAARAQSLSIEIGDRPYYSHGPRYWSGEYQMVWVPGHWSNHHRTWVHGHYVRGEHRRHWDRHHHDERLDDRYDNRH